MKRLLLLAFVLGFGFSAHAAEITTPLPKKCEAFRPDILYTSMLTDRQAKELMKSADYGQRTSKRGQAGQEFWIVFSDRESNPTYIAPQSKTEYKRLDFNEKVRIAQIENGWALVYSEPKEQETYPRFSGQIEWKGWIKMDKLLLWNICPANDKGIYNKAMLCINLDEQYSGLNGKCLKNPDRPDAFEPIRQDFTYYFVMKEQGNMVLLAYQNTMNGQSYKVLYGWVDRSSFVAWNQRSCLEPNWDPKDREYFATNGIKVNIYEDPEMTKKASWVEYTFDSKAPYKGDYYRMAGDVLRYPILENNTEKAWNCSTFSSPGTGSAINKGANKAGKGMAAVKKNMDALVNINIAFVMDGTKSMNPYYPAVKQTIKEMNSYFPKNWHVKVGFVIYRDKADGNYVTEMVPMTNPDNEKLAEWLDKGGEYGIKSDSRDHTMAEALYYGINRALDGFNFNPDESNLMFVIGDCGDAGDYPDITEESLVKKLAEKNVSLMGFQVRNDAADSSFPLFNSNITSLIKSSLQQKYNRLVEENPSLKGTVTVSAKLKRNEYEFSNTAKNAEGDLFIGSHKFVQTGTLPVEDLKKQIEEIVTKVKANVDHQLGLFTDFQNNVHADNGGTQFLGSDITGPKLDQAWIKGRLSKMGANYDEIRKNNATVSFRGYTPKKDDSDHEYYKTVIFISQQEFNTMLIRLRPLYEVANRKGDDREPYVKAMKALLQGMIPNITDAEMNSKGYDEVMAMVAGLNAQTTMSKGRTITEVANPQAVSASEYQSIINKFKRRYQELTDIQKKQYAFVREFNGAKYYWIPTDVLP